MYGKRGTAVFLTVLSVFVLVFGTSCAAKKDADSEYVLPGNRPDMKMYMKYEKVEPNGGITEKNISCMGVGATEALKLFDGDANTYPTSDTDMTVTLDMGCDIIFSQIRYYTAALDAANGNNCLGTRFYASADNKKFVELAVIEESEPPEKTKKEIDFSGFGVYRYFRVMIPSKANLSEIEWLGTEGLNIQKRADGLSDVNISLEAYDIRRNFEATILAVAYNKNNVMKKMAVYQRDFTKNAVETLDIKIAGTAAEEGDSYRVIVLNNNSGGSAISAPLEYRINGAAAKFSVASVFGSNMIIQADKPIIIWGKAPKMREVKVQLTSKLGNVPERTATADENSNWEVNLGTLSEGGDYTLTVRCDGEVVKYKNITVGDVWICTGQSNMDYYMMNGDDTAKELKNPETVKNKNIRVMNLWNMGTGGAASPVDNLPLSGVPWRECDADTIAYCSAVGYYFSKDIQAASDKPVGIINIAVGDTEINRWISKGTKSGTFTSTDGDLYNNRINPLSRLAIKGIILYQGEADQYRTHLTSATYSDAMSGLINSYRGIWGADLPFYWAQLARYKVDESLIREGQRETLYKVSNKKNIGMISLLDIYGRYEGGTGSCREDIHPWDKKTVGERFARLAKRDCYGGKDAATGPMFKSAAVVGNTIVATFESSGNLSVMDKNRYADRVTDEKIRTEKLDTTKLYEFEIAAADGVFKAADAKIDKNTVILSNPEIKTPMYVRYAWGAYPEMPNLTDDSGLPAATFTTLTEKQTAAQTNSKGGNAQR